MKKIFLIPLLFLLPFATLAQNIPDRPNPPRLVNDFSSVLTGNEVTELEQALEEFARETSTQILVVTVKSLDGDAISDYAFRLGEKWGVGQKSKDNGVVIIIKPKMQNERGEAFIATGYGIEHLIPDAVASRIVNNEMIPHFKQNDYYGGLVAGVKVVMDLTKGEYTADAYTKHVRSQKGGGSLFFLVILIFFIILPILRGRSRRYFSAGGSSLPFWLLLGMMGSQQSNHSGSFGNFTSGGGGFGGFGGFGGGSFGGGGAGGSW